MGTQRALLATAALAMLCLVVSSNSASDGSCSAADPGSCVRVRVPYKGISMLQHSGALQKVEAHHLKVKSTKASPKCGDFKAGGACAMPDGSRPDWHQLKATTDSDEQCQGLCEAKMEEDKSSGQATESGPTEHKSVTCTAPKEAAKPVELPKEEAKPAEAPKAEEKEEATAEKKKNPKEQEYKEKEEKEKETTEKKKEEKREKEEKEKDEKKKNEEEKKLKEMKEKLEDQEAAKKDPAKIKKAAKQAMEKGGKGRKGGFAKGR